MAGQKRNQGTIDALERTGVEQVKEWVGQGWSVSRILKKVGQGDGTKPGTTQGYYKWLNDQDGLKHELAQIRQQRADELPWEARERLEDAEGREEVAKARELARIDLWVAERRGAEFKPEMKVENTVNVIELHLNALQQAQESVEAEIIQAAPQPKQLTTPHTESTPTQREPKARDALAQDSSTHDSEDRQEADGRSDGR
jgi:hypothetical protein